MYAESETIPSAAELETAVDAKKEAGTFGKWLVAMKASKYTDADALL